jgi:hypothetical protein
MRYKNPLTVFAKPCSKPFGRSTLHSHHVITLAGQPLQKFINLFQIPQGFPGGYKLPTFQKMAVPVI